MDGVPQATITAVCSAPKAGEFVSEGVEDPPFQSVCNDLATIKSGNHHFAGNKIFDNNLDFEGSLLTCVSTVNFTTSSFVSQLGRNRRRSRVLLTDADQTVDVEQGDILELVSAPGGIRTIKLRTSTSPVPLAGEQITIIVANLTTGHNYSINREDNTAVCEFWGNAAGDGTVAATFDYTTVWRLGQNSGGFDEGTGTIGVKSKGGA